MGTAEFSIGVNYWPVRAALRLWRDFDEGEIREDLDRLAEWRLDPLRLSLRWEDVQPVEDAVDVRVLRRLERLAGWAAQRGLRLWLCPWTGCAHRALWVPGWATAGPPRLDGPPVLVDGWPVPAGVRNPFDDPRLLAAQGGLLQEVLAVLAGHPAFWALDLGDRLSSLFPPRPRDGVRRWLGELCAQVRARDEQVSITVGLQPSDLLDPMGLTPALAAEHCTFLSVAALPHETPFARRPADPLAPLFLVELARALAGGAEVWPSAVGVSTTREAHRAANAAGLSATAELDRPLREVEAENYARECLELLRRAGAPGAIWRAYADYWPSHWRRPPFDEQVSERSAGLLRDDWRPKPTLEALQSTSRTRGDAHPDPGWMDLEPEAYWRRPVEELPRLYKRFREWVEPLA